MIRFDAAVCGVPEEALSREWLETNGLGGFASSTICGANTRRYHGLLVAAMRPPTGRVVLLSKLDETLVVGGERFDLSSNLYPSVPCTGGYQWQSEFRLDPFPVTRWVCGDAVLEKTVWMVDGHNTTVVEYALIEGGPCSLELRPLVAFRDYHALTHANGTLDAAVDIGDGVVSIRPYADQPRLYLAHGGRVSSSGHWYLKFQYPRERERGLDWEEDLFQPLVLTLNLEGGTPSRVVCSTEWPASVERPARAADEMDRAAASFLVKRGDETSVIAGYHWFTDWGRDTMISLPGLTLDNPAMGRRILRAFAPHLRQGLLPNRFPDYGEEPEYNASDATLWFVEALRILDAREFLPQLEEIIAWRERGTLFNMHMDNDGLLSGGAPGVQLTWMDAKVNGRVVTPRQGKPVEIQALWHHALRLAAEWSGNAKYASMAERALASFRREFWNAETGCLFDVIDGEERDGSIRPNQLVAMSLLEMWQAKSVLDVVDRDLLTPFGLRTLSPADVRYQGRYEGGPEERDGAYHQGTVWPWLLGPYARAYEFVHGVKPLGLFEPFRKHLLEAGVGQISEIFDGDAPHAPRGCIAQAWSVGELRGLG